MRTLISPSVLLLGSALLGACADEAGNRSPPLVLTVSTPDETPPDWGDQKEVRVELVDPKDAGSELRLDWKPPSDTVGVVGIALMCGDEVVAEIDPEATSHRLALPEICDAARLVARDAAGLRSAGLPLDLSALDRNRLHRRVDKEITGKAGLLAVLAKKGSAHGSGGLSGPARAFARDDLLSTADIGSLVNKSHGGKGAAAALGVGGLDSSGTAGRGHGGLGAGRIGISGRPAKGNTESAIERPGGQEQERAQERATVRIDSISTSGDSLDSDEMRALLLSCKQRLLGCYRDLLQREADQIGSRIFSLEFRQGEARTPLPRGGSLRDAVFDHCLAGVLGDLKAPGAMGQATVMLSFQKE